MSDDYSDAPLSLKIVNSAITLGSLYLIVLCVYDLIEKNIQRNSIRHNSDPISKVFFGYDNQGNISRFSVHQNTVRDYVVYNISDLEKFTSSQKDSVVKSLNDDMETTVSDIK